MCENGFIKKLFENSNQKFLFFLGHSQEVIGHRPLHISSSGLGGHLGHHQSLAELLRSTTLEEFLEAVEKVEADEEKLISSNGRTFLPTFYYIGQFRDF